MLDGNVAPASADETRPVWIRAFAVSSFCDIVASILRPCRVVLPVSKANALGTTAMSSPGGS